jgi:ERCC4-related helicase
MKNDLTKGACPSDKIVLIVFDEAHRASGAYAYCTVIQYDFRSLVIYIL